MTSMQRMRLGDLDISHRDVFERDIKYIYDEIFLGAAYDHPHIKLSERPTILDVGANVGFYSIWAARKYRPRLLLAYEASPTTYECLVENVGRHVEVTATTASCFNRAVSRVAGQELTLNQPPWNSGFSTLVDGSKLPWVDELRGKGELITHKVQSTTVSQEIAAHGLTTIDVLKIDVEGHFVEVLEGIAVTDLPKVRNIVLEAEYADELGQSRESLCERLRGMGYSVEAKDAAQIMIYAWRD
jgi:FkbM family methyltransferase